MIKCGLFPPNNTTFTMLYVYLGLIKGSRYPPARMWGPVHKNAWRADGNNWQRTIARLRLHARSSHTKLLHFGVVSFRARQSPHRFHARRRAPPLHSACQRFGNAGVCFWLCSWWGYNCRIVQTFPFKFGLRRSPR